MFETREDLLGPRDALMNRWGRPSYLVAVAEPPPYFETESLSMMSASSGESTGDSIDVSKATPDFQLVECIPGPDAKLASRQSSYNSTRSPSVWSVQSVLSAITSPSTSRRGSEIASMKVASGSAKPTLPKPLILPQEVLVCIVQHLRNLHEGPRSSTCSSCFNRDAFDLALINRAWDKAIRSELYRYIHIDGLENSKRSSKGSSRLKLLRRTLRDRTTLAKGVQELRIWNVQKALDRPSQDQIASIIMACPNLQLFTGSLPFYCHDFSRLHHALSTRRNLQSYLWVIGVATSSNQYSIAEQKAQFLSIHSNWNSMKTLALRCQREANFDSEILAALTQLLPSLDNLSISGFDEQCCNDDTLLALKPLKALRLADLPGITDKGLSRFSSTAPAKCVQSLSLINLHISSLYTIARLLSSLNLSNFTLTHFRSLTIPSNDIIFQPFLASRTLQTLHWEVPLPTANDLPPSTAHLCNSIKHAGFPSLQSLRTRIDTTSGAIQSLCKPYPQPEPQPRSRAQPHLPASQISGSSLRAARLRALARSAAGSRGEHRPGLKIKVTDPEGDTETLLQAHWLGYVGCDRRIEYVLTSDAGPWEQRRILAEEGDLLGDGGDAKGCRGMVSSGRRGHVERTRWRAASVERLF